MSDEPRKLSRNETHDLGMIIKERAKVLKAHIAHQAAVCLADFEEQMAREYSWDEDEVWKEAVEDFKKAAEAAQEIIERRCRERGIPAAFAPGIGFSWHGRGQNAVKDRRSELRRAAEARIDAMSKEAAMRIEREALDLRTQVVAMALLSAEATKFLQSMATVEEAMPRLQFLTVKEQVDGGKAERQRRLGGLN